MRVIQKAFQLFENYGLREIISVAVIVVAPLILSFNPHVTAFWAISGLHRKLSATSFKIFIFMLLSAHHTAAGVSENHLQVRKVPSLSYSSSFIRNPKDRLLVLMSAQNFSFHFKKELFIVI